MEPKILLGSRPLPGTQVSGSASCQLCQTVQTQTNACSPPAPHSSQSTPGSFQPRAWTNVFHFHNALCPPLLPTWRTPTEVACSTRRLPKLATPLLASTTLGLPQPGSASVSISIFGPGIESDSCLCHPSSPAPRTQVRHRADQDGGWIQMPD